MTLKCQPFYKMVDEICSENLSIILFGCGVIGRITTPEILRGLALFDRVVAYSDNDSTLWGTSVELYGRNIPVLSPDEIKNQKNIAIFLNISRYAGVLEQLNEYRELDSVSCYLIPMMCIYNFKAEDSEITKGGSQPIIPKILNYIWLGGNAIPDSQRKCIESWEKYCPDYEIRRWDESNYDFHAIPYMAEAYDRKAFGFAPDYARLDILYRYGGFYLDTDVELIKPLDDLCFQEAFCGVEKWQVLNPGGLSGAVAGNEMIKAMRDSRISEHFVNVDGSENRISSGYFDTKAALEHGYRINGKLQQIDGMTIYPSDFFHPYDYMSGRTMITENTYSIHHFGGSWLTPEMEESNRRTRESYQALYEEALRNGE